MFEKKKKATKKNENLMKKAPAAGAVELGDDVLEAAAGGWPSGPFCSACGAPVSPGDRSCCWCDALLVDR